MQRTGLTHISSMTAVCRVPRADTNDLDAGIGEPPWQSHLMRVCQHHSTKARLKRYERAGTRAMLQCLDCGQSASNFIRSTGVTEEWDEELEQRVRSDYEAAMSQWRQRKLDAVETARDRASRDWWESYDRYRKTAVWALKRELVLERCGGVCEACGQRRAEHVHHERYPEVWGHEMLWDLRGVCVPCHKIIHPHME